MTRFPLVRLVPMIAVLMTVGLDPAPARAQLRSPYNSFPRFYLQRGEPIEPLTADDLLVPPTLQSPMGEKPKVLIQSNEKDPTPFDPIVGQDDGGLGGSLASGTAGLPGFIGDLFSLQLGAMPFRAPPVSGGLKVTENEGMRPQDRVYVAFNYFNDVNRRVNQLLGGSVTRIDFYRETYGFEKTVLGGRASVGLRLPLAQISAESPFDGMGGAAFMVGDLGIVLKGTILDNPCAGNYLSCGMVISVPSGRGQFGSGTAYFNDPRDTVLQGFVGYILRRRDLYFQGCNAWILPTSSSHASELTADGSFGWIAYQAPCADRWLTGVIPILEFHVLAPIDNITVRHNPLGEYSVVDFTEGVTTQLGKRTFVTVGVSEPVTGPKPFAIEGIIQVNVRY